MKTYSEQIYFLLAFGFALLFSSQSYAQVEGSVYSVTARGGVGTTFVTDYQAIGINPANIGIQKNYRDPKFTLGLLEANTVFSSEGMNTSQLFNAMTNYRSTQFSVADREKAITQFTNASTTIDANVMLLGLSFKLPKKWGSVAFSARDRVSSYTVTNEFTADLMFMGAASRYFPKLVLANGDIIDNPRHTGGTIDDDLLNQVQTGRFENDENAQTFSQLLEGTKMKSTWVREFNLSYGAQLLETYDLSIYGGLGVRYLQGLMIMDFDVAKGGTWNDPLFSSTFVEPVDILSSTLTNTPSSQNSTSMTQNIVNPKTQSNGWGLDIGFTFVIKRNFRLGIALNNYGSMVWKGQKYSVGDNDFTGIRGQGLNNYNIFVQNEGSFQFAGNKSPLEWELVDEKKVVELPTTLRIGASYEFFRLVNVGVDVIIPQNDAPGNLQSPLYAIGGDFKPFKLLTFTTGFNYGGNSDVFNWPLGVTYSSRKGTYELGVSTADFTSFFSLNGESTTVSVAAAALRFKL